MQNRKLLLGIIAFFVIGCCVIAVLGGIALTRMAGSAVTTDRARAVAIGHEIADYDLPTGYSEAMGMDILYKAVFIDSNFSGMTITMMQFPTPGTSREEMELQLRNSFAQQSNTVEWERVGERTVTIKGKSVTLTIDEGLASSRGNTMRREIGVFDGKGGLVMLMVMGDKKYWDATGLDEFLSSIR